MTNLPVFAHFQHPEGGWYRLWIDHTEPKTGRGHPWHLHANYDRSGTMAPVAGTRWYEQPYGMANWDFNTLGEAIAAFQDRGQERIRHGYEVREGAIPDDSADRRAA